MKWRNPTLSWLSGRPIQIQTRSWFNLKAVCNHWHQNPENIMWTVTVMLPSCIVNCTFNGWLWQQISPQTSLSYLPNLKTNIANANCNWAFLLFQFFFFLFQTQNIFISKYLFIKGPTSSISVHLCGCKEFYNHLIT